MTIRQATENDIPTIVEFQKKMALETENITLNDQILLKGIWKLFKDSAKGIYYLAEEGTQIAGCLMTTFEWSDWRDGTVMWIQSVYIDKRFRGQGVYKRLYKHIQGIAQKDPGIKGVRLYVDKSNKDAQQVYQKLGMNGDHYKVYEWMKI